MRTSLKDWTLEGAGWRVGRGGSLAKSIIRKTEGRGTDWGRDFWKLNTVIWPSPLLMIHWVKINFRNLLTNVLITSEICRLWCLEYTDMDICLRVLAKNKVIEKNVWECLNILLRVFHIYISQSNGWTVIILIIVLGWNRVQKEVTNVFSFFILFYTKGYFHAHAGWTLIYAR